MNKRIKQLGVLFLCSLLIIVSACGSGSNIEESLKEYYEQREDVKYVETLSDLDKDHVFEYEVSGDMAKALKKKDIKAKDVFTVYVNSQLDERFKVDIYYDKKEKKLLIEPEERQRIESDGKTFDVSNEEDWGIYPEYFLVQNMDLDTGKALKQKEVTSFTIERDIETPEVKLSYQKDGKVKLSWDEVSGAKKYALVKLSITDAGESEAEELATTKKTKYVLGADEVLGSYKVSEDEQYRLEDSYWWENDDVIGYAGVRYAIVAMDDKNISTMGWPKEYDAKEEVCAFATYAQTETNYKKEVASIESIPSTVIVSACDGNTVYQKPKINAKDVYVESAKLHVPYTIDNSALKDEFIVSTYDEKAYEEQLKKQVKKINKDYKALDNKEYTYKSKKTVAANAVKSSTMPDVKDKVFSTSELEEYIAKNMIDGAHIIDFSAYYNSDVDMFYLHDLLQQIINQNPMIMQVKEYDVYFSSKEIYVHYLYDPQTRKQKQQAIRDAVKQVSSEIIKPGMKDEEKVYAINDYICNQAVYDTAAADVIKTTGKLGEAYYDSNTAYGILINKIAVCEGYSTAFQLLCEAAGLECISISGHMNADPDIRHAWNRVNIGGQWYIVDVTTNDGDAATNSVLLLSDAIGEKIYTEDEYFLLDDNLDDYKANDDKYEYYRYHGLYVNENEASSRFISMLGTSNTATLKLPETITPERVEAIANQVFNSINRSIQYHWLNGVLTIIAI
ncbi:hypothetical protein M2475_001465 [Breznakia sp. PF5-3]|uniref:transglutaminase domain-containing protein n=1 Tax=unclassified Breznakia TaxID=2623764 RepID=UPI0024071A2E|nr:MULTISPECIES: transglutaminase domain-containing protein [unclassified Breznakia]MDF9825044.1 hypothetical protein [Breznakia sp. PM6-1]MDF9835891.1 hypothetical protein [Breznakia sp. PF5-3]